MYEPQMNMLAGRSVFELRPAAVFLYNALSLGECMMRLNNVLAEKGEEVYAEKRQLRSIRDSIILYNSACSEVWSYGDCQCMVGG